MTQIHTYFAARCRLGYSYPEYAVEGKHLFQAHPPAYDLPRFTDRTEAYKYGLKQLKAYGIMDGLSPSALNCIPVEVVEFVVINNRAFIAVG